MDTVVNDYLATWNAQGEQRTALLQKAFAQDVTYTDPLAETTGRAELDAVIDAVQRQFAGMTFTPIGEPDRHHSQVRFQWGLGPAGAEPVVIGFDVVVLDGDGRVADVRGFLDKVPS
ncbi:nuclear transport factor 2 family protein [Flexivirga meconopsidis]|uniref:nuclear transport factor 2 family protein n=1 Tax=Flexivirga meconopsidis TaxID=2977121 RepID=UPI00223EB393|nr:nuclear transport factor 2 family protein [Flexivirga meconopsidis]